MSKSKQNICKEITTENEENEGKKYKTKTKHALIKDKLCDEFKATTI